MVTPGQADGEDVNCSFSLGLGIEQYVGFGDSLGNICRELK